MSVTELKLYFGKLIRVKRKEKKMTQEQLAELAGISATYLRSVEQGKNCITWGIWLRLCIALQLDINDLMKKVKIDSDYLCEK